MIVCGFKLLGNPLFLFLWPSIIKYQKSTSSLTSHVHDLYNKINKKIEESNFSYKLWTDFGKRFKIINVDNYMIILICLEWFSSRTVIELHARSASPFKILNKFKWQCLSYIFSKIVFPKILSLVLYSILKI